MSGPAIAGWLALLVFLPVVGVIAYFVGRRSNEQEAARRAHGGPDPRMTPEVSAEMDRIAALYRKGAINAYEREQAEAKLLNRDWFGG